MSADIAIIGGGIAGLALALNLHQCGVRARVYEASPSVREMGVGITLLPHAVRELTALGLEKEIAGAGIENAESAFFNRFGQRIYAEPRGRVAGYPYPEYGIHRGRLHMLLFQKACARLGADAVIIDRRFVGLEQDEKGVTLHFQSTGGETFTVRADAAVACDGINSAVRKIYYPDEALCYQGINTWRGVTWRPRILGGHTYMRIGSIRTGKLVVYPIAERDDGSQLINWVAETTSDRAAANDWNRSVDASETPSVYGTWTFDWLNVPDLIAQAEMIFEYPMVDKDPIPRWTFGRVTLAGDAAHPMYPRGSNGAAQALIDARALADALATAEDTAAALAAYEDARRDATAAIVRANRTTPPDVINIVVEDLTGDRPFADLDALISQEKLRALSDDYRRVAGFGLSDVAASRVT